MTKSSPHSSEDIAQTIALFFAVRRVIRTKLAQGEKRDSSTWLRVETMKFIADHDEPKMKALAQYLSITAPSVTTLVAGLIKNGLVKSTSDIHDRRASRLTLTKKGERELHTALTRGMKLLGETFAALSSRELHDFIRALSRITENED